MKQSIEETRHAALARFGAAIESAHLDGAAAVVGCCADTIRFEDPISRVNGLEGVQRVFDDTWRLQPGSRFRVRRQALSGNRGLTRWSLVRERSGAEISLVEAIGESTFDEAGRIVHHVDYWDSVQAAYRRVPLLGRILELIRRRISSGWEPAQPQATTPVT